MTDLEAKNLWTAGWLAVQGNMAVNVPPIAKVQNVLRTAGFGLKLGKLLRKIVKGFRIQNKGKGINKDISGHLIFQ